jgi:mannose-6-phosphate isomerase-like protein (cupin superfamily)
MKKFDIAGMQAYGHEQRDLNVFFEAHGFKMRVINLASGERMPECNMASNVIFVGIEGEAEVVIGMESTPISKGQCLVTEPATVSMRTKEGVRILGIQIQ